MQKKIVQGADIKKDNKQYALNGASLRSDTHLVIGYGPLSYIFYGVSLAGRRPSYYSNCGRVARSA